MLWAIRVLLRLASFTGSVALGVVLGIWLSMPAEVPVGKGDTWGRIAARHGVSVQDLRAANPGLAAPRPGEMVHLPLPRWRFLLRAWGIEPALRKALAEAVPTPRPSAAVRRPTPTPAEPAGPVERRDLAEAAFERINAERQARGLHPLAWDEGLYQMALARARDMWERKYYSHNDPVTGASLIPCRPCGEVLSGSSKRTIDPVASWRSSPPHWDILMSPRGSGAVAVLQVPPTRLWDGGDSWVFRFIAVGLVR